MAIFAANSTQLISTHASKTTEPYFLPLLYSKRPRTNITIEAPIEEN